MARGADTLGRVQIQFPITFSAITSVALLGVTYWYWRVDSDVKNTLIFFLAGAAAVAQITASFYTARILSATLRKDERDATQEVEALAREDAREKRLAAREDAFEKREQEREKLRLKQAAFRFGERWNDPSMYHARETVRAVCYVKRTEDELNDYLEKNPTNVIHVVNFLEEIATSCKHGVIDQDVIRNQFDFVVTNTWETLYPWIKKHRTERRAEDIWEDLEGVYHDWSRIRGMQRS
jgi:hypothetical protein